MSDNNKNFLKEGDDDSAAKVTFPVAPSSQESGAELERLLEEAEAVIRESTNTEVAESVVL